MNRITIYGWAIPRDDPYRGKGSGTFIRDLTYLVDEDVSVEEVLRAIEEAGCKFIVKRDNYTRAPEQDRVTIEHVPDYKVGIEYNVKR